jgi:hypothetical protein
VTRTFAWNFAGSGLAAVTDLSGNGRGFTPTGNTVRTAPGGGYTYGGTVPGAIGLTQSAADVQLGPTITGLNTTSRTVCGWAKIATSFTGHFMEWYRNPADDTGVFTWLYLSAVFRGRAKNSSGTAFERNVTPNTAYRFYAMTHDGANLKVYQDNGAGTLAQVGADVPMAFAVWAADAIRVFDQSGSNVTLSDWQGFDTALTLSQLQAVMVTPVAASGLTQPANPAAETDSAQPIARRKIRAAGITAETDTAQPIGRRKTRAVGITTEADAAQPLARRKVRAVGTAVETDTPSPIARIKTRALGLAAETDMAQPTGRRKTRAVSVAAETSGALLLGRSKVRVIQFATEVDAAQLITKPSPFIGIANETDQALPIGRRKVRALGIAVDLSSAVAIGRVHYRLLGTAAEVEEARHSAVVKRRAISTAHETDLAVALVPSEAPTESVLTTGNALSSVLTVAHPQPVLTPSNAPSSHLEVSHGV